MDTITTKAIVNKTGVIQQCDIFKNVEFLEYAIENENSIEFSKITFPHVIVLTQACDLQQDHDTREKIRLQDTVNQDKLLISVIVAPIYNFEDFRLGTHLEQLGMKMQEHGQRQKSKCANIIKNETKRYHYLNIDDTIPIVESVIDFKHYFSVTVNYLNSIYDANYVCSIDLLYRELISQRFSFFLSRIGLPDSSSYCNEMNK